MLCWNGLAKDCIATILAGVALGFTKPILVNVVNSVVSNDENDVVWRIKTTTRTMWCLGIWLLRSEVLQEHCESRCSAVGDLDLCLQGWLADRLVCYGPLVYSGDHRKRAALAHEALSLRMNCSGVSRVFRNHDGDEVKCEIWRVGRMMKEESSSRGGYIGGSW